MRRPRARRARWTACAPTRAPRSRCSAPRSLGKLLGCAGLCHGAHRARASTSALATTLLVYTLTLMVALVGPLPGGIGVADASLGALLIANGVSGPTAAAAVIAFRLLDLWLPLLVGAAAGARQYRRNRAAAAAVVLEPPLRSRRPAAAGRGRHELTRATTASARVDDACAATPARRASEHEPGEPEVRVRPHSYVDGEICRPPAMTNFTWSP